MENIFCFFFFVIFFLSLFLIGYMLIGRHNYQKWEIKGIMKMLQNKHKSMFVCRSLLACSKPIEEHPNWAFIMFWYSTCSWIWKASKSPILILFLVLEDFRTQIVLYLNLFESNKYVYFIYCVSNLNFSFFLFSTDQLN